MSEQARTVARCRWHGDGCRNLDCRDSGRWMVSEQARTVAEQICRRLHNHWPDDTSVPDVTAILYAYAAEILEAAAQIADQHRNGRKSVSARSIAASLRVEAKKARSSKG